jgi:predicted O-methyltransferase YrrM
MMAPGYFRRAVEIIHSEGATKLFRKILSKIKRSVKQLIDKVFMSKYLDGIAFAISKYKLNKRKGMEEDLEDILDTAYSFQGIGHYSSIRPLQVREEWIHLLRNLSEVNPDVIVEIGTANGGSLYTLCRYFQNTEVIISIDLPGGEYGGGYPKEKEKFLRLFTTGQDLVCLRSDSHLQKTKNTLTKILDGRKIDFLYIDGDHTYEGVKKDFEMYGELVSDGGVIGFDDLLTHSRSQYDESTHGVKRLWEELKPEFDTVEIISEDENTRAKGLGLLYKQTS